MSNVKMCLLTAIVRCICSQETCDVLLLCLVMTEIFPLLVFKGFPSDDATPMRAVYLQTKLILHNLSYVITQKPFLELYFK